jgi:hypothetical protein
MLIILNSSIRMLAALATTLIVGACTTPGGATTDHGAYHPGQASPSDEAGAPRPGGAMMGGQSGSREMDMNAMCAAHRRMHNAPPEQRQAMMDQYMKGMSPEMRQQHMEMMQQKCK